jgi:hypothetical protein
MLNNELFLSLMTSLERFYGLIGHVTNDQFIEDIYYSTLKNCSDELFEVAIATCIKKNPKQYSFFPSAEQILEYAQGEYRPPGQCTIVVDYSRPALSDGYVPPTPEQAQESAHRGRLMGRIISYGGKFMSYAEKDSFITSLKNKPTHELEHMAKNAELGHQKANNPNRKIADLKGVYAQLQRELEARVSN